MSNNFEAALKERAARMAEGQALGDKDTMAGSGSRESWRDRLERRGRDANREATKAAQYDELLFLLHKHPEVARILELLEAVGGF
jgi:hypothetical protein